MFQAGFAVFITLWLTASTMIIGKNPSSRVLLKVLKRLFRKLGSRLSSNSYSSTFLFTLTQTNNCTQHQSRYPLTEREARFKRRKKKSRNKNASMISVARSEMVLKHKPSSSIRILFYLLHFVHKVSVQGEDARGLSPISHLLVLAHTNTYTHTIHAHTKYTWKIHAIHT